MVGPPSVFPRSGDISGAWAPKPQQSPVEWAEVEYGLAVPVTAVRVFETNRAGSTFAVVDCTDGERLLNRLPGTLFLYMKRTKPKQLAERAATECLAPQRPVAGAALLAIALLLPTRLPRQPGM